MYFLPPLSNSCFLVDHEGVAQLRAECRLCLLRRCRQKASCPPSNIISFSELQQRLMALGPGDTHLVHLGSAWLTGALVKWGICGASRECGKCLNSASCWSAWQLLCPGWTTPTRSPVHDELYITWFFCNIDKQ